MDGYSKYQIYKVFDDTTAQVLLALERGDSIHRVAQSSTRLQDGQTGSQPARRTGYVRYDDSLSVVDDRMRDATRELVAASAYVSVLSIEEAYVIPQFGG